MSRPLMSAAPASLLVYAFSPAAPDRIATVRRLDAALRGAFLAVIAAALAFGTTAAEAHAYPHQMVPAAGGTVPTAPTAVSIWFTEELEPAFSTIKVTDAAGQRMDKADSHIDPADPKLLHVSLRALKPGAYRVRWDVVSQDTHRTHGYFSFTVKP